MRRCSRRATTLGYDRRVFAPTGLANGVIAAPRHRRRIRGHHAGHARRAQRRRSSRKRTMTRGDRLFDRVRDRPAASSSTSRCRSTKRSTRREIVVTYEFDAPGNAARTIGGRAETSFGPNHAIKLGFGYVNDTSGAGNIALATRGSQRRRSPAARGRSRTPPATARCSPPRPTRRSHGDGGSALHAQLTARHRSATACRCCTTAPTPGTTTRSAVWRRPGCSTST